MISRLVKIIGLFCRKLSLLQGSFAKETYNFKEPTNRKLLHIDSSQLSPAKYLPTTRIPSLEERTLLRVLQSTIVQGLAEYI